MTTSCSLADRKCVPCRGGVPALRGDALEPFLRQLDPAWQAIDQHHLERTFRFPDFARALAFTQRTGELAEKAGHHPEIQLSWGKVVIRIWTHAIDGLTESDFILAAKIDRLPLS